MSVPGKTRHLLTFSYIGSYFKASTRTSKDVDLTTVIGSLELAFQVKGKVIGIKDPSPIVISSRTDRGVHAFHNTAHIDFTIAGNWYNTNELVDTINIYFNRRNVPLRISSILQVSNDFNARRWAHHRSYLYRIGVRKPHCYTTPDLQIPISEVDRCHFLRDSTFNVDAVEEVLSLYPGVHNFCSFSGLPTKSLAERSPIRCINACYIKRGRPLVSPLDEPASDNFDYWDFIIEGRSFLYRQVRRMVSAAIAVGQGKQKIADVQRALESSKPIQLQCPVVPPHGLYLSKVTYREKDLLINRTRLADQEHVTLVYLLDQYKLALKN